jgi:oligopeptide transport system ATP-binding protein
VNADTSEVAPPLLAVKDLTKHFPVHEGALRRTTGTVRAVDGVSFDLRAGETLGIVGESGCGKSTLARTLMRMEEPTSGEALYQGRDIFAMGRSELRRLRREIQMVFQDPYASLNPRMTVEAIIQEAWTIHSDVVPRAERADRLVELLNRVGLSADDRKKYPYQFSGGQRQRIGTARALALRPKVLVCDEPVSALDVSVQAQVINLLEEIQETFQIALIFIAHDLAVVRHISDRVAVMYLGRIVELGDQHDIYEAPVHPYTQALLSSVPVADPALAARRRRILLQGDVPSPLDAPSGCHFRTRCWKAEGICSTEYPALVDRFGHGHSASCHFAAVRPEVSSVDAGRSHE